MRVFVSEYLVGGACTGMNGPPSMRREGLAMLRAVTEDIAKLSEASVVATLEAGLSLSSKVQTIWIEDPQQEGQVFRKLLGEVDHVLIIAPETAGILAQRCRLVRASDAVSWNCSPDAIELCGDKLRLSHDLLSRGISTPVTSLVDFTKIPQLDSGPIVLKPRDGAGSSLTFLIKNLAEFHAAALAYEHSGMTDHCICQPYHAGRALSVGVNISLDGRQLECLPVAEQRLSDEGRFQYLGGRMPADLPEASASAIRQLVLQSCRSIDGLAGYVGVDLVLSPEGIPTIVEINPRLTTSYIGYRQLFREPLPRRWLSSTPSEPDAFNPLELMTNPPIDFTLQ